MTSHSDSLALLLAWILQFCFFLGFICVASYEARIDSSQEVSEAVQRGSEVRFICGKAPRDILQYGSLGIASLLCGGSVSCFIAWLVAEVDTSSAIVSLIVIGSAILLLGSCALGLNAALVVLAADGASAAWCAFGGLLGLSTACCIAVPSFVIALCLLAAGIHNHVLVTVCVVVPASIALAITCGCCFGLFTDNIMGEVVADAAIEIDATIKDALGDGTILLLSCSWLLQCPLDVLSRHQELPLEAFLSPEEAVAAFEAGMVYMLSYAWNTASHPDPHGLVLSKIRCFLASSWAAPFKPSTFGLFWDFASIPQRQRTQSESKRFEKALQVMSNLYGSLWRTCVLQLTQSFVCPVADMEYNPSPYGARGWCIMEEGAAQLAAFHRGGSKSEQSHTKLIDISKDEPTPYVVSEKPTIQDIEERIRGAKFTGKGDKQVVMAQIKGFNTKLHAGAKISALKPGSSLARAIGRSASTLGQNVV